MSARVRLSDPLRRSPAFRSLWAAGLLANLGQLIQNVGAAWEMTRLTDSIEMVALVQSAGMLPMMLLTLPSGALADMVDKRKVALFGLSFACLCAASLTIAIIAGVGSPALLLGSCVLIGTGVALYAPAMQSSVPEQVESAHLPSAIALNSISYNIARSLGPALGGLLLAAFGAAAAFGSNALLYLPMILAAVLWKRPVKPSRLPPETMWRAVISGMRYALHSPPIRSSLVRTFCAGCAGSSVMALLPLVAKDLLGGESFIYGLLLGSYGVGAIIGAFFVERVRSGQSTETAIRGLLAAAGVAVVVLATSRLLFLSCCALAAFGAAWMLTNSLSSVCIQLSAPRWVAARAVSTYTCSVTAGMTLGAAFWGKVASHLGLREALLCSAFAIGVCILIGLGLRMPDVFVPAQDSHSPSDLPEIELAVTERSGPVVIEIDYRVATDNARSFYNAMTAVRSARMRSGAFGWSLARHLADRELWTERYHCPTWGDYLRQRSRLTEEDIVAQQKVEGFVIDDVPGLRVRRMLERPLGSVRQDAETPDTMDGEVALITP
ncbi:MFS transporter [Novosphingobium malaysiense]|uniref:MFS transporter n=1 Tax=Novosphingobium malaysiense TaxID=1348853 RepID=A0A0B1ZM30_9SPHN|nr:MFS transporter [Novosphingobium malaysiense]KHK90394.1 hypothetical protein LK12_17555 [Novosphingobium malaysiense]